ncbi:unnamed protein product [Arctia plantaginis]|uniref:Uncharacterized protein n=1 Tax=Arctia plantaginis TaxID=874455 RepID=A0A8S1A037_ARCPL|nr:unnamed protein product [Arctia plantaginis]
MFHLFYLWLMSHTFDISRSYCQNCEECRGCYDTEGWMGRRLLKSILCELALRVEVPSSVVLNDEGVPRPSPRLTPPPSSAIKFQSISEVFK